MAAENRANSVSLGNYHLYKNRLLLSHYEAKYYSVFLQLLLDKFLQNLYFLLRRVIYRPVLILMVWEDCNLDLNCF